MVIESASESLQVSVERIIWWMGNNVWGGRADEIKMGSGWNWKANRSRAKFPSHPIPIQSQLYASHVTSTPRYRRILDMGLNRESGVKPDSPVL